MNGVLLFHGAELVHLKHPAVLGQPLLLVEHVAPVLRLDGDGAGQHNGAGDHQAHQGQGQVHHPLVDALFQRQILGQIHDHGLVVQGHILGPLAHHVHHLKVIIDILLFLVAVLNQVHALLQGHVIEEHRVVAGDHIQHLGIVVTDDFVHLILLAEPVDFGDNVPQALPGRGDDAALLRRGQGKIDVVSKVGEKDNDHQLQENHQQQPLRRLVDKVGVVLFAGVHNGKLQVGHQVGDDGGQSYGMDNGPALLGADGVTAVHLHQGNAQHHKGHHGDACSSGKVKQPGIVDAEDAEENAEKGGEQRQLQHKDNGPLQLFYGVHSKTVLIAQDRK